MVTLENCVLIAFGFFLATLFWGVLAHKWPSLFSGILAQGVSTVNQIDSQVKAQVSNVASQATASVSNAVSQVVAGVTNSTANTGH